MATSTPSSSGHETALDLAFINFAECERRTINGILKYIKKQIRKLYVCIKSSVRYIR